MPIAENKTAVASAARTREWDNLALALRERAFFSAGVEQVKTLQKMQDMMRQALTLERDGGGTMTRARFVADMRVFLGATDTDSNSLTDLGSSRRLKLIYDMNTSDAHNYARWQRANDDADFLKEFPAQELIRVETRKNERDWEARWLSAGGKLFDGTRMIARKDSPIWAEISRFKKPWPPFDFGSGMGVEDIDRFDAEDLGLIQPNETITPPQEDFNARLEASLPDPTDASIAALHGLFGDQIVIANGKVKWDADALGDFYDEALEIAQKSQSTGEDAKIPAKSFNLGKATPQTVSVFKKATGFDLTGWTLNPDLSHVYHAIKNHGQRNLIKPGSGEDKKRQVPLTREDFRAIPLIWRHPDNYEKGEKPSVVSAKMPEGVPPTFRLQSNICGQLWVGEFWLDVEHKRLGFGTAFRRK